MLVEIRRAIPADAAHLTEIAFRAKASWGYPASWLELWRDELTVSSEYLALNLGFVAVHGADAVGCCVLEDLGNAWRLEHFWVEPEWHGRTIGSQLLHHARDAAKGRYAGSCEVVSDPNAEAFYVRHGAVRVRTIAAPMPGAPDRTLPVLRFEATAG